MSSSETESVEAFRARAREFIRNNLRPQEEVFDVGMLRHRYTDEEELAQVARDREVQRMLFDAQLAGVCVPVEYGGLGLTREHQHALNQEIIGYEFPSRFQSPTMNPIMAVLLDFGTEEQKREHIPRMLSGDELWMQLLSEPSGGSDVAGALTTAMRDGDEWILNGSKVWTTGAWWSDWGLCLARTNWDVPKHRGLTVFIMPLDLPGVDVHRIEMVNGFKDFCQEFLSDVRIPDAWRVGEVDDGWTVGTRWMTHERMLYNSPLITSPAQGGNHGRAGAMINVGIARDAGRLDDPTARDLIGEAMVLENVGNALAARIGRGIRTRTMSDQAAAIGRLFSGITTTRNTTITHELSGAAGMAWIDGDDGYTAETANDVLMRQVSTLGGGTTEMARNVISERVLGMPREWSHDKDLPFSQVPKGPPGR